MTTGLLVALLLTQAPDAGRAAELHQRAMRLDARGDAAGALTLLWEASGLAPRDAEIQNALGEALDRLGALDAAVGAFQSAVSARPAFRKASNNLILALVKAGRGKDAVQHARAGTDAAPDDPEAWFAMGLAQTEEDVEGAIASFRRALDRDPGHTLARYNLALALKRSDRMTEALDELQRVIERAPRPEAHYTAGVIHLHQGHLDRAAAALRAAVASQPHYADAHYTLGAVLHAQREWRGAAAALRRAIELRPDLHGAHYTLGRVLQASGDGDRARHHLAEAERLRQRAEHEQQARVWTSVGTARLEAGDAAAAIEYFQRATAILDVYAPAHYQMGRALQRAGRADAAKAAFARALELNPGLVPPPGGR